MGSAVKPANPFLRTDLVLTLFFLVFLIFSGRAVLGFIKASYVEPYKAWETLQTCENCPTLVIVPGGNFQFGSPDVEPLRFAWEEGPAYSATVEALAISKTETLLASWEACQEDGSCSREREETGLDDLKMFPVNNISWDDIVNDYIPWLNSKSSTLSYRLPTEVEWEYLARAGVLTPFPAGREISSDNANFRGNISYAGSTKSDYIGRPVPDGNYIANPFGLHDVQGNLLEWTNDCWIESLTDYKLKKIEICDRRALRGGSWLDEPNSLRFAYRRGYAKTVSAHNIGFRLVADLDRRVVLEDTLFEISITTHQNLFDENNLTKQISPNYSKLRNISTLETINILSNAGCEIGRITKSSLHMNCKSRERVSQIMGEL